MKQNPTSSPRKALTLFGVVSVMFCLTAPTVFAKTSTSIPETLNLNIQVNSPAIKGLPKDKKSVNNFSHQKHANEYLKGNSTHAANTFNDDFTCAACHSEAKNTADIIDNAAQDRLLVALNSKGGPKKLKNYFHGICLKCHKSMKKAKIATGPTKCNGCHKR